MESRCQICNHDKSVSSDDDTGSDHCIEQTTSHHRFKRSVRNQYQEYDGTNSKEYSMTDNLSVTNIRQSNTRNSESNNQQSKSDNPDSFNEEYSSEEEEVVSGEDGDVNGNNAVNSVRTEVDSNIGDDNKGPFLETKLYSNQSNTYSSNRNDRPTRSHSYKYTTVRVPSGKNETIVAPNVSGWRCGMRTRMITLKPNGRMGRKEHEMVEREMRLTIHNGKNLLCNLLRPVCSVIMRIVKIQKIENGCLWNKFKIYQDVVRREVGYVNERLLFHGTPIAGKLVKKGFDERFSNTGGLLGAGIYFAEHSSKSNEYAFGLGQGCRRHNNPYCTICNRQMLLCRVTLGRMEVISWPRQFSHAPPGKHSVMAKISLALAYPEYVVYRGEQAYPEYLITYRSL